MTSEHKRRAINNFIRGELNHILPPKPVLLFLITIFLYLFSSFFPIYLQGLSLIKAICGFILLSFAPGYLLMRIGHKNFRIYDIIYSIALSLVFSMIVGFIINILPNHGVLDTPFRNQMITWGFIFISIILMLVVWSLHMFSTNYRYVGSPTFFPPNIDFRVVVCLSVLPIMAVSGSVLFNKTGNNLLSLVTILVCGITPVIVVLLDQDNNYLVLSLISVSTALILQNTIFMTYLAYGDGVAEYSIARIVLQSGQWVPGAAKDAMVRIGILHPMYAKIMGISLLWEFKLIHPVLFISAPITGFLISARYFSGKIAYLGTILYIFLPETYRLIPRNTRTGSAIIFAIILILVLLDSDLPRRLQFLLSLCLFWGCIVSHYVIGPLMLFFLTLSFIFYEFSQLNIRENRTSSKWVMLTLMYILSFSWYRRLTDGTDDFIIISMAKRVEGLIFYQSSSTAATAISYTFPSLSYKILYYSHIIIAGTICASVGIIFLYNMLELLDKEEMIPEQPTEKIPKLDLQYLSIVVGFALLFPLSFGPSILSAPRTFGFLVAFLSPFVILMISLPFQQFQDGRIQFAPSLVFVVILLLFTSGFIPALITEDPSRQPNLNREQTIESGSTVEKFALYRTYNPLTTVYSSEFIGRYFPREKVLYRSRLGNFLPMFGSGQPQSEISQEVISNISETRNGYVYIATADTSTQTITTSFKGFIYYDYVELPEFRERGQIYTNGKSTLIR